MSVAEVHGTEIYFEEVGEGPVVLICHGGPGVHHGPYHSLDPLGDGRKLVFWDHRGHGRSGRPPRDTLSMPHWADDAAALAGHLGIERAAVLGHSFGGWVAQELALRHPGLVGALVLASSTAGQLGSGESDEDQGPPMPTEVLDLLSRLPGDDAEAVAQYSALAPHFMRDADPEFLRSHLNNPPVDAASMIAVFEELSKWSSADRLGTIACPTLVLGGRHDVFSSYQQAERIARRVPGAELVEFAERGHFMWAEEPERFFSLVSSWLTDKGF